MSLQIVRDCILEYSRSKGQDIHGLLDLSKRLSTSLAYLAEEVSKAHIEYLNAEADRKNKHAEVVARLLDLSEGIGKSEASAKAQTRDFLSIEYASKGVHVRLKGAYESGSRVFEDIRTRISYLKREYEHRNQGT